jgi:hypothetical protein
VKLMGAIFDLDIPSAEKLVLLAMADYARDDGTGCYPAIATLAKKTSLSRRGIQKLIRRLQCAGFVADTGKISKLGTIEYTVTLEGGGEQGSLPFSAQGANARTKTGEPECAEGANQSAKRGRTGFARTKDLTPDLTKDGSGSRKGGGCQDQVIRTQPHTVHTAPTAFNSGKKGRGVPADEFTRENAKAAGVS